MKNVLNRKENSEKRMEFSRVTSDSLSTSIAQFYVFHEDQYIGWDCFNKTRVTAGCGQGADLVLLDDEIQDIQAVFHIKGDKILVSSDGKQGVLKVNDKTVTNSIIGTYDEVRIGKFTLKIKLKALNTNPDIAPGINKNKIDISGKKNKPVKSGVDDVLRELILENKQKSENKLKSEAPERVIPCSDNMEDNDNLLHLNKQGQPDGSIEAETVNKINGSEIKLNHMDDSLSIKPDKSINQFLSDPLFFYDDIDLSEDDSIRNVPLDVQEPQHDIHEIEIPQDINEKNKPEILEEGLSPEIITSKPDTPNEEIDIETRLDEFLSDQNLSGESVEENFEKPGIHFETTPLENEDSAVNVHNTADDVIVTTNETGTSREECILQSDLDERLDDFFSEQDTHDGDKDEDEINQITYRNHQAEGEAHDETQSEKRISFSDLAEVEYNSEVSGLPTVPVEVVSEVNKNDFHIDLRVQENLIDDIVNDLFDDIENEESGKIADLKLSDTSIESGEETSEKPGNINELIDFLQTDAGDVEKDIFLTLKPTESDDEKVNDIYSDTEEDFKQSFSEPEFDLTKINLSDPPVFDDFELPGEPEYNAFSEEDEIELSLYDFDKSEEEDGTDFLSETQIEDISSDQENAVPEVVRVHETAFSDENNGQLDQTDDLKKDVPMSRDVFQKIVTQLSKPERDRTEIHEEKITPASNEFIQTYYDDEEEEDDCSASFSLRDKLVEKDKSYNKNFSGRKAVEIIRFHNDTVLDIRHISTKESITLVDNEKQWCELTYTGHKNGVISFSKPLLEQINRADNDDLHIEKLKLHKKTVSKGDIYQANLPDKGDVLIFDGNFEYLLRSTFIQDASPQAPIDSEAAPAHKRILRSKAFKYLAQAALLHLIALIILSFNMKVPGQDELKKNEPRFVVMETKNIHKPVKPKKKPKPVAVKPKPKPVKPKKQEKKPEEKRVKKPEISKVASVKPKKTKTVKAGKPKAGGGHKGNLVNRNINNSGLLGTLGIKDIGVKPNKALAAVTNIDAVTSTRSSEARVKVGGLVGSLGDKGIAIPGGDAFVANGSTNVLRSAGIGGEGSVASLEAGNTGNRAVAGVVSAPLSKRVKFKGGGISREAVAKVINQHIDEINYCYETALISDPSLMGKVVFEWKILTSGRVGEVKIKSSTIKSDSIHSCIKSAIRSWNFPKPKGADVVVSYPFVFDVAGF